MQARLALTQVRQLTKTVSLARNEAGVSYLVVERDNSEAIISLYGAHLIHYAHARQPWLWLSQSAKLDGTRPIRGGVPLCWPWFGPSPERVGLGKPQHGFARTSTWTLDGISEEADNTLLHLSLRDNAQTLATWPHPFELELDVRVGDELTMMLTTRNTGSTPLVYSGALHSYLQTQAPELVKLAGLGSRYIDRLQDGANIEQSGFTLDKAVDRTYTAPSAHIIDIETGHTSLKLDNHQADSVVVWNPWKEGAATMADFDDDGWKEMICVETAITDPAGITVDPDEEHTFGFILSQKA